MHRRPPRWLSLIGTMLPLVVACHSDSPGPGSPTAPSPPPPVAGRSLAVVSGDRQTGLPGRALAEPLVVRVIDSSGEPLVAVDILWRVVRGGGEVLGERVSLDGEPGEAVVIRTDASGQASAVYVMGPDPAPNEVEAWTLFARDRARFLLQAR